MKLVKLEIGAPTRQLERYTPRGKGEYYEVDCPFCGRNQMVQTRKFHQGVRCANPECRAMMCYCTHDATRDMVPRNEVVMWHGQRTWVGAETTLTLAKWGERQ